MAVIDRWFADPANKDLRSSHFTENIPSSNVLRKLGFHYVGEHRVHSKTRGHEVDGLTMRLTRESWEVGRELPCLSTPRTRTRPMTGDDAPELARIAEIYESASNTGSIPAPWSGTAACAWINAREWTGQPGFCLALCDRQDHLIGLTGCSPVGEDGTVSIMYLLRKDLWGRGIATEAAAALVAALFRCLDLPAITADHFVDNPASGVILRRLGFDYLGQNTGSSLARLEPAPISLYRLDRSTFEARL